MVCGSNTLESSDRASRNVIVRFYATICKPSLYNIETEGFSHKLCTIKNVRRFFEVMSKDFAMIDQVENGFIRAVYFSYMIACNEMNGVLGHLCAHLG